MAELVVDDITWKKGESGTQNVQVFQSDGIARKNLTGIALTFKMWLPGASANKATATCSHTTASSGETAFTVSDSTMTNAVGDFLGEFSGDDGEKTNTFNVKVKKSAPA